MKKVIHEVVKKGNENHPHWYDDKQFFILIFIVHAVQGVTPLLANYYKLPLWYIVILWLNVFFSLYYHLNHKNLYSRMLDWISCFLVVGANFYVLFSFTESSELVSKLTVLIPVCFVAFYLFFSKNKYRTHHIYWHLLATMVTVMVIV